MTRGLVYMMIASVMFAVMNTLVYQTKVWHPDESSMMASFIRVLVNLLVVVVLSYFYRGSLGVPLGIRGLFGDFRASLWMRGFFGTLSVIAVFYAVHAIGVAEAGFLNASNAVWVGLLGPLVLRQPNSRVGWIAICLGIVGLFLIYQPQFTGQAFIGRSVALASGFFGACAYMMVSRAGRSNHPLTVVFYFTLVATLIHLAWFTAHVPVWPHSTRSWNALLGAGFAASIAQVFMTKAYQEAPALYVSAVSNLTPVINLCLAIILFSDIPNTLAIIGACFVVASGVALPLFQSRLWRPNAAHVPLP